MVRQNAGAAPARGGTRLRAPLAVALVVLVALTALLPRVVLDQRVDLGEGRGFTSRDPDTLYQMRRLARFFEEGWSALVFDASLNHPNGSAIPWPAGHALVQAAVLGPGLPDEAAAARRHIQQGVASLPLLWGVLAVVVVSLCALRLAGPTAGVAAGLYMALCGAPIEYSRWGNGDHHAFVLLLTASWLLVVLGACRSRAPRLRSAILAGLLCGWALVTWVPCVFLVAIGVVSMFAMLLQETRDGGAGAGATRWWAAAWGVALLVVLPFSLTSPWTWTEPWNPVYLTLIQPAALLVAGLVPASRLARRRAAADGARARRQLLVWAAVFVAGGVAFPFLRHVLPSGLDEAASVLARADKWHDLINESRPLLGRGAHPLGVQGLLGLGFWLVPIALVLLAREAWRTRETALVPVLALALITGSAALLQIRFADLFAIPISLLLALGLQRALAALGRRADVRLPAAGTAVAGVLTLVLLQAPIFARLVAFDRAEEGAGSVTSRTALEWLAAQGASRQPGAVLAMWGQGHPILWYSGRPTVASNFGPFTGRDGFEAPPRFLLERDADAAEALLAAFDVAFVVVRGNQPASVGDQLTMLGREQDKDLVTTDAQGQMHMGWAWLETMGGRLFAFADPSSGALGGKQPMPGFLRLVYASPPGLPGPATWLYERVPGAILHVRARPGEALSASVAVTIAPGSPPRDYVATTTADAAGLGPLRVPYATGLQGSVRAGACRVSGDGRAVELDVGEQAVLRGKAVEVRFGAP
jgi:hypothetical protein